VAPGTGLNDSFSYVYTTTDSALVPDSAWLDDHVQPASATLFIRFDTGWHQSILVATVYVSHVFTNKVDADSGVLKLYANSIQFAQLKYWGVSWNGGGAWSLIQIDSIAQGLLHKLHGATVPRTSRSVDSIYAAALVAGDTLFKGFPANAPVGIGLEDVRAAAIRQVVAKKRPLSEIVATWGLDLGYNEAKNRILALRPHISTEDSVALFPGNE
jgi:hypothetical protein